MNTYFYDIEVYPNLFCVTFVKQDNVYIEVYDEEDDIIKKYYILETRTFIINSIYNHLGKLLSFIRGKWIIGFNNLYYDDLVINYMYINIDKFKTNKDTTNKIYDISCHIISHSDIFDDTIKLLKYYRKPYASIDLMKIALVQVKSLKQTAINLKWYKIQDLPYKFNTELSTIEQDEVINYNINDVLITRELFLHIKDSIILRFNINDRYKINVTNRSKSGIADVMLANLYSKFSGLEYIHFKDGRTYRRSIKVAECISTNIKFESKELNEVLNHHKSLKIQDTKDELKLNIIFNGVEYNLGTGGLHSKDRPAIYINDKYKIIDKDVTSYYPAIIINEEIYPAHLDKDAFLNTTKFIRDTRVVAKEIAKDNSKTKKERNDAKIEADTLKITVNSGGFGKMGFEHHWVYDRKAMVSVTINGQLFLLMLIEKLVLNKFRVISANTDGVVTIVPPDREDEFHSLCKEWELYTNFQLEDTYYKKYIRIDVNNYMCILEDGTIKYKGRFMKDIDITKGYDMPIVAIALYEYFVNNKPVVESIRQHCDIYSFCKSQKVDARYNIEYHIIKDGVKHIIPQQKNVRFYVSNQGGSILKRDVDNSLTNICAGENITIFNDYIKYKDFSKYNINYEYYIKEAQKIVDIILYNLKPGKKMSTRGIKAGNKKNSNVNFGTLFDDL